MNYLHLSHIDLDGYSSNIVLKKFYINITLYTTTYGKIQFELEKIFDKLSHDRTIAEVFVTDLSFNQNQFDELLNIIDEFQDVKFTFIDHHPHEISFSPRPNLIFLHTEEYSATKILANHLGLDNDYINAVDAFDCWKKDSPLFDLGFILNTLFWEYKSKGFIYAFKNMEYPSKRQMLDYEEVIIKKDRHFKNLKDKGLFIINQGVLVSFSDKYLNWIQVDYPNEEFYINATSYGTVNIRVGSSVADNKCGNLKDILTTSLQSESWFLEIGGHPRAYGISNTGTNNHEIIVECVKHILNEIQKMRDDENS